MKKKTGKFNEIFEKFSTAATKWTGSSTAFLTAFAIIIVWLVTGPVFHYSDTWQLIINTGTTIVTFLMVFLIQKTQNKDSLALQLKLNELVAAHEKASNRIVDIEDMSQEELETLHRYYGRMADRIRKHKEKRSSLSIENIQKEKKQDEESGRKI